MIGRALVVLAPLAGIYAAWPSSPMRHAPGAIAPREPVQTAVSGEPAIGHRGLPLVPLARFEVEARVLSTRTCT